MRISINDRMVDMILRIMVMTVTSTRDGEVMITTEEMDITRIAEVDIENINICINKLIILFEKTKD